MASGNTAKSILDEADEIKGSTAVQIKKGDSSVAASKQKDGTRVVRKPTTLEAFEKEKAAESLNEKDTTSTALASGRSLHDINPTLTKLTERKGGPSAASTDVAGTDVGAIIDSRSTKISQLAKTGISEHEDDENLDFEMPKYSESPSSLMDGESAGINIIDAGSGSEVAEGSRLGSKASRSSHRSKRSKGSKGHKSSRSHSKHSHRSSHRSKSRRPSKHSSHASSRSSRKHGKRSHHSRSSHRHSDDIGLKSFSLCQSCSHRWDHLKDKWHTSRLMDDFRDNNVVQIINRVTDGALRVTDMGTIDCKGEKLAEHDEQLHFIVRNHGSNIVSLKTLTFPLRSNKYLKVDERGKLKCNGNGKSDDCKFRLSETRENFVTLENYQYMWHHIAARKSGSLYHPRDAWNKMSKHTHFDVRVIGEHKKTPSGWQTLQMG